MNMKRMRGRNHRPNGGGGVGGGGGFRNQQNGIPLNRNHVFDSSGPEMRIRGTAQQLHEKYTQLARDASSSGDRVTGESYYQYAEHYFRIISAINQAAGQNGQPAPNQSQPQQNGQNGYQHSSYQQGGAPQNGGPLNGNEYQGRRPQHNQGGGGNFYQEPAEPAEARGFEPRQQTPNQTSYDRRDERPRAEPRLDPAAERRTDPRIDISSALEAELAAAAAPAPAARPVTPRPAAPRPVVAPAGSGAQPSLNIEPPAPEARAIPISTVPPQAAAPAGDAPGGEAPVRDAPPIRPRPRGRPRIIRPETVQE